jgi:hypothetical protein
MSESLIEIRYDEGKLNNIRRILAEIPRALPTIMPRAINRTAVSTRAELISRLYERLNLTKTRIRQYTLIKKATRNRWSASVFFSRQKVKLIYFAARPLKGKGVSYAIERGGARTRIIEPPRSAFIQTMPKSGHVGVFKRKFEYQKRATGVRGRLKDLMQNRLARNRIIDELKGPSIGEAFEGASVLVTQAHWYGSTLLEKNIDDQVRYILNKWRATAKGTG